MDSESNDVSVGKITHMWSQVEKLERGWLTYKLNKLDGTSSGLCAVNSSLVWVLCTSLNLSVRRQIRLWNYYQLILVAEILSDVYLESESSRANMGSKWVECSRFCDMLVLGNLFHKCVLSLEFVFHFVGYNICLICIK